MSKKVVFIGSLPPPLNGASYVNKRVIEILHAASYVIDLNDTCPEANNTSTDSFKYLLQRLFRCLSITCNLFFSRNTSSTTYYISLSGGKGQVFDLLYTLVASIRRVRVIYHHHSYAYLTKSTVLFGCILKVSDFVDAKHIFLSQAMSELARDRYSRLSKDSCAFVSNSALIFDGTQASAISCSEKTYITIGYLSNITPEKGGHEFIDLVKKACTEAHDVRAVMAGPCSDRALFTEISRLAESDVAFEYLGPIYNDDKEKFLSSVDLFLFPSNYSNEAEPLVLIEAALAGCRIIASDVGTIMGMKTYIPGMEVCDVSSMETHLNNNLQILRKETSADRYTRAENANRMIADSARRNIDLLLQVFKEKV